MKLAAALAVLAIGAAVASAYPTSLAGIFRELKEGNTCRGDGTYYGSGQDSYGTCQFQLHGGNKLPWATGNQGRNTGIFGNQMVTVSLNSKMFENSFSCGLCIKFRCSYGNGNQYWKPPQQWTYAIVNNQCPECDFCALDIPRSGDGRWKCEWVPIECPVGGSKFRYGFAGSHDFYLKIAVMNSRVPTKSLEVKIKGQWKQGAHSTDNHFMFWGGGWGGNIQLRVTSVHGDVVYDSIGFPGGSGSSDSDSAQFPSRSGGPPPAEGPADNRKKKPTGGRRPVVVKSKCKFYLQKGWQCGGKGGYCNSSTGCKDAKWKTGCCKASTCKRQNSKYWYCR